MNISQYESLVRGDRDILELEVIGRLESLMRNGIGGPEKFHFGSRSEPGVYYVYWDCTIYKKNSTDGTVLDKIKEGSLSKIPLSRYTKQELLSIPLEIYAMNMISMERHQIR